MNPLPPVTNTFMEPPLGGSKYQPLGWEASAARNGPGRERSLQQEGAD